MIYAAWMVGAVNSPKMMPLVFVLAFNLGDFKAITVSSQVYCLHHNITMHHVDSWIVLVYDVARIYNTEVYPTRINDTGPFFLPLPDLRGLLPPILTTFTEYLTYACSLLFIDSEIRIILSHTPQTFDPQLVIYRNFAYQHGTLGVLASISVFLIFLLLHTHSLICPKYYRRPRAYSYAEKLLTMILMLGFACLASTST